MVMTARATAGVASPTGQQPAQRCAPVRQPHTGQYSGDVVVPTGRWQGGHSKFDVEVFLDCAVPEDVVFLKHEPEVISADLIQVSGGHGCCVAPKDCDGSSGGAVNETHNVQEGGLPDPEEPTMATRSPAFTWKLTPCSAWTGGVTGYVRCTLWALRMGTFIR